MKKKKRGENTLILGLINGTEGSRELVVASATAFRQNTVQRQNNTIVWWIREGSNTLTHSNTVINSINRAQCRKSSRKFIFVITIVPFERNGHTIAHEVIAKKFRVGRRYLCVTHGTNKLIFEACFALTATLFDGESWRSTEFDWRVVQATTTFFVSSQVTARTSVQR